MSLGRAGECSLFVTEKFAFHEILRNRTAVHGHKRFFLPRRIEMHRTRDKLFAGAVLTSDQHARIHLSKTLDDLEYRTHLLRTADELLSIIEPQFGRCEPRLLHECVSLARFGYKILDVGFLNGLFNVIVGTLAHRLDGVPDIPVRGDDQNRNSRVKLPDFPEHIEAGHSWHTHVEENHMDRSGGVDAPLADEPKSFLPFPRFNHVVPHRSEDLGDRPPEIALVIDDQNIHNSCLGSGRASGSVTACVVRWDNRY